MMRLFLLSLALTAALIVFAYAKAGTERVDLSPTTKVLVFSTPSPGKWHSRMGLIHSFTDAVIYACFEWKTETRVQCLVIANDGETLMMPLSLVELKT